MGHTELKRMCVALGVPHYLAIWGRPYVVGAAIAVRRYHNATDCIWLGKGDMPEGYR
jgi:hypothetical protein